MASKKINIKHDAIFKKYMQNKNIVREFIEYYLPKKIKSMLDLSTINIDTESFIEKNLKL